MKLQFYVFITAFIVTFEYGKGVDGLQKQVNGLKQTNNSKSLLMIVINNHYRNKPIIRTNLKKKTPSRLDIFKKTNILGKIFEKKKKMQEMQVQRDHELGMKEIIDFMKTHIYTTDYLLKEVQRIKRDRVIKDELREMVTFLEKPDKLKVKRLVLDFFNKNKMTDMREKIYGLWNQKPNGAVINVLKDPFNDGVVN